MSFFFLKSKKSKIVFAIVLIGCTFGIVALLSSKQYFDCDAEDCEALTSLAQRVQSNSVEIDTSGIDAKLLSALMLRHKKRQSKLSRKEITVTDGLQCAWFFDNISVTRVFWVPVSSLEMTYQICDGKDLNQLSITKWGL